MTWWLRADTVALVMGVSAHDAVNYDGYPMWWVWMLEHGLDGLVGALLAVGLGAFTLWRDRVARRDARSEADRETLRRQVIAAQDRILRLRMKTHGRQEWTPERGVGWYGELFSVVNELRSHSLGVAPAMDEDLTGFIDRVIDSEPESGLPDPYRLRPLLTQLEARLQGWVLSPDRYAETVSELVWPGLAERKKFSEPPPAESESALVAFARRIDRRLGRGQSGR